MTPALDDVALHPFEVALRIRFRRTRVRRGVLVEGPAGWAEFSPFPEYPPAYARRWLAAALDVARHGVPDPVRDRVPVNVTIPAVPPDVAHARTAASPCRTAKVKVAEPGQSLADDLARVAAVRAALGPAGRLRVDANAGWDLDGATRALLALAVHDLDYAEQPVAALADMAELRRRTGVRVAADESLRTARDPRRIADLGAADVLVVKAQPLGGPRAALGLVLDAGLPVVVSSALETSVGIAAGLALAAAVPDLDGACGLATADLLAQDLVTAPLLPDEDGTIAVRRIEVDPASLARQRPAPHVAADLLRRVHAAATAPEDYV